MQLINLPNECLLRIICFSGLNGIISCSIINKNFYELINTTYIFNNLIKKYCGLYEFLPINNRPKKLKVCKIFKYWFPYLDFYTKKLDSVDNVIPPEIGYLSSLTTVCFQHNTLKIFPQSIFKLDSLKYLTLTNNPICEIPKEITRLTQLQYIDFSNNSLEFFPESITYLPKVRLLNLSFNPIKRVSRQLSYMTSLTNLDLTFTHIKDIDEDIVHKLNSLKELKLHPI